jgi:hypothetical protein
MPSSVAVREMFQLVLPSTSTRCSRMAPSSDTGVSAGCAAVGATAAAAGPGAPPRKSASGVISLDADISTARSITFDSSRTLPGQWCSRRAARAATVSVLGGTP